MTDYLKRQNDAARYRKIRELLDEHDRLAVRRERAAALVERLSDQSERVRARLRELTLTR